MTRICLVFTTVVLLTLISAGQSAPPPQPPDQSHVSTQSEADATDRAMKLAKVTRDFLDQSLSTPGTHVELREQSRTTQNGILVVKYEAVVKGAPKDQTYTSFNWPINAPSPVEQLQGLTISDKDVVICAGRQPEQCGSADKPDDPVDFMLDPAKGEPYRMALVSKDGRTKLLFGVVPDPIIGKDKGCTLEAIRVTPRFETTIVRAKGYQPDEALQMTSKSYDESHDAQIKADSHGEYFSVFLPFVKGKQRGKTDVRLKGSNCAPTVSFEWGQ